MHELGLGEGGGGSPSVRYGRQVEGVECRYRGIVDPAMREGGKAGFVATYCLSYAQRGRARRDEEVVTRRGHVMSSLDGRKCVPVLW